MNMGEQKDTQLNTVSQTDALIKAFLPDEEKTKSSKFNKLRNYLIVSFSIVTVLISVLTSTLIYNKSNNILTEKVSSLTYELTVQMRLTIDKYLTGIYQTSSLIFSEEVNYTYSATDTSIDEYDALATESKITDFLYSVSIMENYADFGLVYENNHFIGKIANGTKKLFGDAIYTDLSAGITNEKSHDGWITGYGDNYKRIYYVKRINNTTIFVSSFYTDELSNVFTFPDNIGDITIRLITPEMKVVYSSRDDEIGTTVPDNLQSRITDQANSTILDKNYLTTVNTCENGWYVVCDIPTKDIFKEKTQLWIYSIIIVLIASLIAIVVTYIISNIVSKPVDYMMKKLSNRANTDDLTGILNKKSFEDFSSESLTLSDGSIKYALILLDVDDFKQVNDTLGHAEGDKVLASVGKLLRESFREYDLIGRIGGDEFCVLMRLPKNIESFHIELINAKCANLCDNFRSLYFGKDNDYKISTSIGVAIYDEHGSSFIELYEAADKALYMSKSRGKDIFTIYSK